MQLTAAARLEKGRERRVGGEGVSNNTHHTGKRPSNCSPSPRGHSGDSKLRLLSQVRQHNKGTTTKHSIPSPSSFSCVESAVWFGMIRFRMQNLSAASDMQLIWPSTRHKAAKSASLSAERATHCLQPATRFNNDFNLILIFRLAFSSTRTCCCCSRSFSIESQKTLSMQADRRSSGSVSGSPFMPG